jgi:hypothetical protein
VVGVTGTAVGGTAVGGTAVGGTAVGGTAVGGSGVAAGPHAVNSMTIATSNEAKTNTFFIFFSSQGNRVFGDDPRHLKIIYRNFKKCK